jgi:hypothetical protein
MYWYKTIYVKLNERVVLFDERLPVAALSAGKHRIWGCDLTEQRFVTDKLVFEALPEVRAILPKEWFREVVILPRERGILFRDGRPVEYLRPGIRRYWTVDSQVTLLVCSLDDEMPELTEELMAVLPPTDYVRQLIAESQRGLLYVRGVLKRELVPGLYCMWSHPESPIQICAVDMRSQQVTLSGQELMTRDKVTLRLTLTAEYSVSSATTVATKVADARDSLYLMIQLAARDYVAGVTLDELLDGRAAMTRFLDEQVRPTAGRIGLAVERVGIKDVVLPGEMKALLNRVIEAEKAAAANVITRREEAAATRLLLNTAKMMAEQPALMRLKELETLVSVAEQIDEVRVVVGTNGNESILSTQLLASALGRPEAS